MAQQIEMLMRLVSERDRMATSATAMEQDKVKLSESDDIEAYSVLEDF